MFLLREASTTDSDQIYDVARHLDTVNLPADRDRITEITTLSEQSFSGDLDPCDREYLFVLEDVTKDKIIGTSMVHAQHGTRFAPHVYFQVENEEHFSESLKHYAVHQCLRIRYNYDGPTEIGGLILLPEYRNNRLALGKLLSYARFLFIAMNRNVFRDKVLSELLPPLRADGTSLLWEHLGRRFTGLSYQEADRISKSNKEFIKALFPQTLIYTDFFPAEVKEIIGKVGPLTKGVEKILKRIGFRYANQIDPFDGGPHFIAETNSISIVTNSHQVQVKPRSDEYQEKQWSIIASQKGSSFRAMSIFLSEEDVGAEQVSIPQQTITTLGGPDFWTVTG